MTARRMLVDIHERVIDEGSNTDEDVFRIADYDVTDIMLEIFGEDADGSLIAAFVHEPHEFPEIGDRLCEDPEIGFHAELSPSFQILDFLSPGMDASAENEEIAEAWGRWRTSVLAESDPHAWTRRRWIGRADDLREALVKDRQRGTPSDAYLPYVREIVTDPAMIQAFIDAMRGWTGDPLEGLRAIEKVRDGLR
jgi:hypothetical protein